MVNIKHFLVGTVFLMISQLAALCQQITFEKGIYDFGKVERNSDSERLLKFRNTGTDTLIFTAAPKTACGCDMATLKYKKMIYAPGEEGTLIYKFDTKSPRKYDNKITIQTNGISEFVTIRVKWEVVQSIDERNNQKTNEPANSNLITADSLIDISVNIEEIIWQDSTKMVFLAITHHDDKYYSIHYPLPTIYSYRNLGGPITIGRPFVDNCLIYPVITKGNTSYFLLDDFIQITDSMITLSITGSTGNITQSSSFIFDEYLHLQTNEIQLKLNGLSEYTSENLANKDWYAKWIKNNPAYKDERILNAGRSCN